MTSTSKPENADRSSEQTRGRILEAAFMEIYRNGYQGMRVDDVLEVTGLTKGALYYHFLNKQALGYAVVDEVISATMEAMWIAPLQNADDPLMGLIQVIEQLPDTKPPEMIEYGCPLNNLAQEMSPLDEGFRTRLNKVFKCWHDATQHALEQARDTDIIRQNVDCDETATFVLAALEGCIGIAKTAQSRERLDICNQGLVQFLFSLKVN